MVGTACSKLQNGKRKNIVLPCFSFTLGYAYFLLEEEPGFIDILDKLFLISDMLDFILFFISDMFVNFALCSDNLRIV